MTSVTPVPEELLAHALFVRRLARSLLRDPHDADDLEQETWRAALEHPPGHRQNLKGWLTRVTQNFARRGLRSAQRRAEHECAADRGSALTPAEVTLEQQEVLQRVVEAVRDLDEPYRAVILARFYEDLPPREIAARLGIPVQTVHTRSKRALRLLRDRLERGRSDWRSCLILLVGPAPGDVVPSSARRRSARFRPLVAVTALLLAALWVWLTVLPGGRRDSAPDVNTIAATGDRSFLLSTQSLLQEREPVMPHPSTLAAAALASILPILFPQPGDGITRLVSVGFDVSNNPAVGTGDSRSACISVNGRYVAFSSTAPNLLPGGLDTNGLEDVFVRDLLTEQTYLVSAPPTFPNVQADGPSKNPCITPDGAYLVFDSQASNLDPADQNSATDIFRVSLLSLPSLLAAELVSLTDGEQLSNGGSSQPVISDDGTVVAFASTADNLTLDPPNVPGSMDIYVRDLVAGTTVMASINNQGVPADRNISEDEAISGDGRFVAFMSNAHNLDPNDTDDDWDVYVFDRLAPCARLSLVSKTSSGASGDGASEYPCISQDGQYISFMSLANDLTGDDTNPGPDLFVRDMWTGQNVLVNRGPGGVVVQAGVVDNGTMTGDGRFLTFTSGGTGYGGHDTNVYWDVYLIDRDRDGNGVLGEPGRTQTTLVSVGPHHEPGNDQSGCSALMGNISRNGNFVVFESLASNFSDPLSDTSGASATYDVFVRDMRNVLRR